MNHMKKTIISLLILCFALIGCNQTDDIVKGGYDKKGIITEIDEQENRILIDDREDGLIWITLTDTDHITRYEKGQEVVVWIDGAIDQSMPAQAKALNIESTTPNQ